jgi:hypothetical protein
MHDMERDGQLEFDKPGSTAKSVYRVMAALAAAPAVGGEALPAFEDAQVQIVYETVCQTDENVPPNPEEHWEGWMSRRIVAALRAPPASPLRGREDGEQLWGRFVNHYWDSFEGNKELVLKHVRAVLDYHAANSAPPEQPAAPKETT